MVLGRSLRFDLPEFPFNVRQSGSELVDICGLMVGQVDVDEPEFFFDALKGGFDSFSVFLSRGSWLARCSIIHGLSTSSTA